MDKIQQLEELIEAGNYQQALALIEEMEVTQKNSPVIQNLLGIIYTYQGQWEQAEDFCQEALRQKPDHPDYLYNLAFIEFQLARYDETIQILDRMSQLTGKDSEEAVHELRQAALEKLQEIALENTAHKAPRDKQVLMIAYFFPPLGGSGVFRSLKFAKYLPDFHWRPTVISAQKPPMYWNFTDQKQLDEVPDFVKIYRVEDPYGEEACNRVKRDEMEHTLAFLYEILQADSRAINLFNSIMDHPDGHKLLFFFPCKVLNWAWRAVNFVEQTIDLKSIDAIYTTSGPYSSHLAGYYLKKKYDIPWVADFRDEWTGNPYYTFDFRENALHLLLLLLEEIILHGADRTICVNEVARERYIERFQIPESKIFTITNGYDEKDFFKIPFDQTKHDKFRIAFCGLIYLKERSVWPAIDAVSQLINEKVIDCERVEIVLMGKNSVDTADKIAASGLSHIIRLLPYGEHEDALRLCSQSDLLLCPSGDTDRYNSVYPGKLFEYIRCGKPILAFAPANGPIADKLKELGAGAAMPSSDMMHIKEFIRQAYHKWDKSPVNVYHFPSNMQRFERKILTERLAGILQSVSQEGYSPEEIPAQTYDQLYVSGGFQGTYFKHYTQSHYYISWNEAIKYLLLLDRDTKIIEIGCGVGQFANMLFDYGFTSYRGIDFSDQAISQARERNPNYADRFSIDDAFQTDLFCQEYDVAIFFEILEHLHKDQQLLERLSPEKRVLLSVPNFSDPNHVRYFTNAEAVRDRYGKLIDIFHIEEIPLSASNKLFLVVGKKCSS